MRRWLRWTVVGLCLTVMAGALAAYRLPPYRYDGVGVLLGDDNCEIASFEDRVDLRWTRNCRRVPRFDPAGAWLEHTTQPLTYHARTGDSSLRKGKFRWSQGVWTADSAPAMTGRWWAVGVPYWFVALLAGLVPLWIGWAAWRRRRRIAAGHCRVCGYDLRATRERCPECGTPTEADLVGRPCSGAAEG